MCIRDSLNTVLYLLGGLFQLHFPQLGHYSFGLFTGGLLALLRCV